MKKIFATFLALILTLSLVGCSQKPVDAPSSAPSAALSSSVPSTPSEPEKSDSQGTETSSSEAEGSPEAKRLEEAILSARSEEENEAYGIITAVDSTMANLIFDMTGLSEEDMQAYAISISPINIKAYGVAVILPAEGKTDTVREALQKFIESQQKAFESYLPDQKEIAENALLTTAKTGEIVFVMCEDAETVQNAILKSLEG